MFNKPSFNSDRLGNDKEKINNQPSKALQVSQLVTGGVLNVLNIGKSASISQKLASITSKIDILKKDEKYINAVKKISKAAMITSVGIQGVNLGNQMLDFNTSQAPKPVTTLASERNYNKKKKLIEKSNLLIETTANTNQNKEG